MRTSLQTPVENPAWKLRVLERRASLKATENAAHARKALIALCVIATILAIVFLKWAGSFLIPLLLGIMLAYTLAPFVNWLEDHKIHRLAGTILVVSVFLGAVTCIGVALNGQVQSIANQLPDLARQLRWKIGEARSSEDNVLRKIGDAAKELDKATTEPAAPAGKKPVTVAPALASAPVSSKLTSWLGTNVGLLLYGLAQAALVVMLAFSLLAAGPLFRRKLIAVVGPGLSGKKEVIRLLEEIQHRTQSYLVWLTITNALIGIAIWGAYSALGVQYAGFWGVSAGLLHFIPYAGPAILATTSGLAVVLNGGTYAYAFIIAGVALGINSIIGVGVMTWMHARIYQVSTTALFLGLMFFGWLWGAWGVLLAAPLLGVIKVICDRLPETAKFSSFLAR